MDATPLPLIHVRRPLSPLDPLAIYEHFDLLPSAPYNLRWADTDSIRAALCISWVCSLWRSIALANPALWARCVSLERFMGSSSASRARENRLRDEFLRRSWPAPLDLYVGSEYKLADPEWLLGFSKSRDVSRIRSLEMHVKSLPQSFLANILDFDSEAEHSLQRLELLLLEGSTFRYEESLVVTQRMLSRAPNLKELRCINNVTVDLPSFFSEDGGRLGPLSRLTRLDLACVTMQQPEDLLQALGIAVNLEVLSLNGSHEKVSVASDLQPQHPELVNFPHLRSLFAELRSSTFSILFPALAMQNLINLRLKLKVDYIEHFPIIIETLERLVENWPGKGSKAVWADYPGIDIYPRGSLIIDSSGPLNDANFAQRSRLYFSIEYEGAEFGDLWNSKPRMAFISQALTHDFGKQLLRVLADPFLSTATGCMISKGKEVTLPLHPLSCYNITKVGTDQSVSVSQRAYDFPDALFSEPAMKNMQEISISDDHLPVLSYILKRVKESIEISGSALNSPSQDIQTVGVNTDTTSPSNYAYAYDFLPNLRTLYFWAPSTDQVDRSEEMEVYKAMLEAGFLIERMYVPTSKFKAMLPGRWDDVQVGAGGVPLRTAQVGLDELLKC